MKRIICGTDFSPASEASTEVAATLSRRLGDELLLVHVLEPWSAYPSEVQPDLTALERRRFADAEERLRRAGEAWRHRDVNVQVQLVHGLADEALAELGAAADTRLIVVGSHGRRGIKRAVLGTVAQRLCDSARCAVLVVNARARSLRTHLGHDEPLRLYVAVDSSRASLAPVAWVRQLRERMPCDVTFAHFYWPPYEYNRLGLRGLRDLEAPDPEVVRVLLRDLHELIGELPGDGETRIVVQPSWGRLGDVLAIAGEEAAADIVVVGTHQRHGLQRMVTESVSRELLRVAHLPVLAVPSAAARTEEPTPTLRRVLAATDFSESGNRAVAYAYALLGTDTGVVDLCHVVEGRLPPEPYKNPGQSQRLTDAEIDALQERLRALVPPDAERHGILTQVHVVPGHKAGEALAHEAERLGADAICLGAHGRSTLGRLLVGSTSEELMRKTSRPLLLVPPRRA